MTAQVESQGKRQPLINGKVIMTGTKKRILLVDDEEVILFGFKQVLSGPDLRVDTASNVNEARSLAGKNSYAAAVVDLRLSNSTVMEGLEVIALLKSTQKNCRIIVLTAYGEDEVRRKTIEAGADLFLEKPVDPNIISQNLKTLGVY
jgi:DNA-binding response OmpR family regulator